MRGAAADLMFAFLERMRGNLTYDQLHSEVQSTIAAFGLNTFGISYLPNPGETLGDLRTIHSWPDGWAERYNARGYAFADPVLQRVRITDDPFVWSEAVQGQPLRHRSIQIMNEATDFGLLTGFTTPIRTSRGHNAVVTMGSDRLELSPTDRGALHMISLYAHSKFQEISEPAKLIGQPFERLTIRERDCVSWCSEGKSSWEISLILGIAKKTVDQHLASAARKLDCRTRPQLVAEAMRFRLIV